MSNLTFEQRIEAQKRISKTKSVVSRYATVLLFFGPYLFFFSVFFLYPLIQGVINSFFSFTSGDSWSDMTFVGWKNYTDILIGNPDYPLVKEWFTTGLGHTALFVVLTVPFLIVIPLIIALLLNKKPWGEGFFRALFFLPNVLSVSTVCLIFANLFNTSHGLIKTIPYTVDVESAWFVLVITTLWWTIGNNMVILNAGLKQVDKSLYEAAAVDGCGSFKQIFYITLPQIANQVLICTITTVIASFNVYGQADLITGGGPEQSTTMFIQRVLFVRNQAGFAGAANAMCIVFSLIIIAISVFQLIVTKDNTKTTRKRRPIKKKTKEVTA